MKIKKENTETYNLTELDGLDPVTAYVTNYEAGKGKIVVTCFNKAWSAYWGGMSGMSLQNFFLSCDNDYILGYFLNGNITQIDYDAINELAHKKGYEEIHVTSELEIQEEYEAMTDLYGEDWYLALPSCNTPDYNYCSKIIDAVKAAFKEEKN